MLSKYRKIFAFTVITLMITAAACGGKTSEQEIQVTCDADQNTSCPWTNFCTAGQVDYFVSAIDDTGKEFLFYYDKASKKNAPLCGKAECTHDDTDCNAFLGTGMIYGLSAYNGRLYFVSDASTDGIYIESVGLDGTGREKERKIENINERIMPLTGQFIFHRGYLFVCGSLDNVKDGEVYYDNKIMAFSLETSEKDMVIFEEESGAGEQFNIFMQAAGEKLYYCFSENAESSLQDEQQTAQYYVEFNQWDIEGNETQNITKIIMEDNPVNFVKTAEGFTIGTCTGKVYKLDDSGLTETFSFLDYSDNFDYVYAGEDYCVAYTLPDFDKRSEYQIIFITNDGKIVQNHTGKEKYKSDPTGYGRLFMGFDGNTAVYYFQDLSGSHKYIAGLDTDHGTPVILWSSEEK